MYKKSKPQVGLLVREPYLNLEQTAKMIGVSTAWLERTSSRDQAIQGGPFRPIS